MGTKLIDQYKEQRKKTVTDSYAMSIGEIVNLYEDGDVDIHPAFQRVFRWTDEQKSKLIDSILLGIPLPSFFVSTKEDGTWDVIDGVQRLSTIFSFLGKYKNEKKESQPMLTLTGTDNLPALQGLTADDMPEEMIRMFKREKINIVIIKQESHTKSKYELFQRLNTNGSSLSNQEVRNCILIMESIEFYEWFDGLSTNENFQSTMCVTERLVKEKYHQELLARFIVFTERKIVKNDVLREIGRYVTDELMDIGKDNFDRVNFKQKFELTFKKIDEALGDNAFRRYDAAQKKYKGPFVLSIFEAFALGLGQLSLDEIDNISVEQIKAVSQALPSENDYIKNSGSGANAANRLKKLIELGERLFKEK
jgi:uncharacterized protein with ParB-like and HNH nuclease domain